MPDVWLITPQVFPDDRGEFLETWRADQFRDLGIDVDFAQDNQSLSRRGVLRGLHYQIAPDAQAKLVGAAVGEVIDVVVDLRQSSPTFGEWAGRTLSASDHQMLWIPMGFAHGFLALTESALVLYKTSAPYSAASERTIRWDDPTLGIEWPEVEGGPLLSAKDAAAEAFTDADLFS